MNNSKRIVTVVQEASGRFLDAHEIAERDFNVVTRPRQDNDTQRWIMTQEQGNLRRFQQVSSGRFLDAHEISSLDFRVVTRPRQENNTQLWHLNIISSGQGFTLRQASSGRFLDAYLSGTKDFQVVTRPEKPGNNAQFWIFEGKE
jgi:Ricin-type beta-trefoil lectin domain